MILVAGALVLLALVDGACSGFRSSLGRTGLVRHRAADREAAAHGVILVAVLLLPAAAVAVIGLAAGKAAHADFRAAGAGSLLVAGPYALVVGIALAAYAVLGWQQKYVVIALVLGPFTLVRPVVAIGAAVAGWFACRSWTPTLSLALAVLALLLVEPLMSLRWRRRATRPPSSHAGPLPPVPDLG